MPRQLPAVLAATLLLAPSHTQADTAPDPLQPPRPRISQDRGDAHTGTAGADKPDQPAAEAPASDPLHAPFDALLAAHVDDGRVDYAGLAADVEGLDAYLASLARVDSGGLDRAQTLALWINAYNAATLRLILDHQARDPELKSIKDIPRAERWLAERWVVAGRTVSLDAIEHAILRPLGEARIHFAINCASRSCPDLRAEAYHGPRLEAQLEDATRRFLADRTKGARGVTDEGFFGTSHELHVSALFDWFEEDFTRDGGSVVAFVRRHGPPELVTFIDRHRDDLDVEHLDYDWSLNRR